MSQSCQSCHQPLAPSAPPPPGQMASMPCGHCGQLNPVAHAQAPSIVVQPATHMPAGLQPGAASEEAARRVWFIEGAGGRQGPLTAVDVLARRSAGAIADDTPIFGPQMAAARPLREVLALLEAPAAAAGSAWHPAAEAAWQKVQPAASGEDAGFGDEHTRNIKAPMMPAVAAAAVSGEFEGEHTRAIRAPVPLPQAPADPRLSASLFEGTMRPHEQAQTLASAAVPPLQTPAAVPPPRQSQVTVLGRAQPKGGNQGLKLAIGVAVALGLGGAGFAAWFVAQRGQTPPPAAAPAAPHK